MGSMDAARRAGMNAASSEIAPTNPKATAKT
jgi:hypothetical protein